MNVLISTTTGWNIGDDFIRLGVQYLLERVYSNITYIYYDRNPDYFLNYPTDWEMGKNHFSNRMNNPIDWDIIDMVVLAGSPEFLHGPLKPIYEGLRNNPGIPLLAIGVGYSLPKLAPLSDAEMMVLNRPNTTIITRQEDLKVQLETLLSRVVHFLPCPALFCHDKINYNDDYPSIVPAVILQAPTGRQAISQKLFDQMVNIRGEKLVHYIDDYVCLQKMGIRACYEPDPILFLKRLWSFEDKVHSTRLHGAIAALSRGVNVEIYYDLDNHRIKNAIEPFKPILNVSDTRIISNFKKIVKDSYIDIISRS